MLLCELSAGEQAVLLFAPSVLLPLPLSPGKKISLVLNRPELTVVEAEGSRFVLSHDLAGEIVVVRAPT